MKLFSKIRDRLAGNNAGENFTLPPRKTFVMAGVFCVLCVLFIAKLLSLTVINRDRYDSSAAITREVEVVAARGQICDRNGVVLVGNDYTYNLCFKVDRMPDDKVEMNRIFLQIIDLFEDRQDAGEVTQDYFPFRGEWGAFEYTDEALREGDPVRKRLLKVLSYLGKKEDMTAQDLADFLIERYMLNAKDSAKEPVFSDADAYKLLRFRYDTIVNQFSSLNDYVYVYNVDEETVSLIREKNLKGVSFTLDWARTYRFPGYASHILGYTGKIQAEDWDYYSRLGYSMDDMVGVAGCEQAFESILHGVNGRMRVTEDPDGNVLKTEIIKEPVPGQDVWLTIDINVQIAAEDGIAENIDYVHRLAGGYASLGANCQAGATVAQDPDTGEILAIASAPTYDLTMFNELYSELAADTEKPLYNRSLLGLYAPGSTFKLGVAAAALSNGTITTETLVEDKGIYYYSPGSTGQRCWIYKPAYNYGTHGTINVVKAIRYSCNYFFFVVGRALGIDNLYPFMKNLGLGEATGIELTERKGTLAGRETDEDWSDSKILNTSIGQGTNAFTPLQICNYVCTLWNAGTRYSVHLLYQVHDGEGNVTYQSQRQVVSENPIDEEVMDAIRQGMAEVIEESNTIRSFMKWIPEDVAVYGKTGTAEVGGADCENALFTCVGVGPDGRKLVVLTVLEEGYSGGYVSLTAGRIMSAYFGQGD